MAIKYDINTGVITWEKLDFELNVVELLNITLEDFLERSEIDRNLTLHGAKQKTNDNTAGLTDAKGYSDNDRIAAIQEVVDHLAGDDKVAGSWNKTKEGSKGKSLSLTNAISKMKELGKSDEEIRESLEWMFPAVDINTLKF